MNLAKHLPATAARAVAVRAILLALVLPGAALAQHSVDYEVAGFSADGAAAAVITFSDGDLDEVAWAEAVLLDTATGAAREPPLRETFQHGSNPALAAIPLDGRPAEAVRRARAAVAARLEKRAPGPWLPGLKLAVAADGSAKLGARDAGRIRVVTRRGKLEEDDLEPAPLWLNLAWSPPGGGAAVRLFDSGSWKRAAKVDSYSIVEARTLGNALLVLLRIVRPGHEGVKSREILACAARLPSPLQD